MSTETKSIWYEAKSYEVPIDKCDLLEACIAALKFLPSIEALPRTTQTEAGDTTKQVLAAIHKALNINQ